ncbi:MAG TPA: Gfo/Idh/MocA family oxidoreductase [Syntrophobacteraceae bacterium]|nr:Gfo/Idh/MocA family oxidoreductase [Syntrophobacteraceae bacterium]
MNQSSCGMESPSAPKNAEAPAVAVIGAGYWGRNLVRNYAQLGALRLICDKNEDLLAHLQESYPRVELCLAFNEALSRNDIDAVVVATPAETHFALVREALLAGKHAFVEKPLVLSEPEAEELIGLARRQKRTLMVGHLLQYHPAFVRLRELADSGELGRINYIYSHRLNLGKIRREENILWSFAPHDISMILSLAKEQPETVLATGGNYLHRKIADVTTTHLEFPSGLKAHIFVSWLHPFKEQKLVVVGDRKMAVFDDTKPWSDKLLLYAHEIRWEKSVPVPAKADPERVELPESEPLKLECAHFLQCVRTGARPTTDGEEGLSVLRVLNASQRSLNRYGECVPIAAVKSMAGGEPSSYAPLEAAETRVPAGLPLEDPFIPEGKPLPEAPAVEPDFFAHPSAVLDPGVRIGTGTKIWHFSHILSGSIVGKNCSIGQNVVVGPEVSIGDGCKIQNNVSVYKGVTLEDEVFCGPSMVFTNVYNPRAHIRRMDELRPTRVKKGATLGANCTIVCGTTIGRYAFIGAGAVVVRDVPDHALMVGNPARQVGWMCRCGTRLDEDHACPACRQKIDGLGA